jgi:hypothetical protein
MDLDFGLFEGDALLVRGNVNVSASVQVSEFGNVLQLKHQLKDDHASILVRVFGLDSDKQRGPQIIWSSLHMPFHDSDDWESIELDRFTFAFMSSQNA